MSMRTMRGMIFLPICLATLAASPGAKPAWVYEAIAYGKLATPHEDAPAILLLKSADVEIKRDGSANRTVLEVYKILSPQYSEDFRFVEWVNSDRKLKSLKGWRVDPKGHEFKLKKENIAQIGLQQSSGYYDDQKQVVAFFDDLKSGDVVAFEYKIKQKKGIDGLFQNFLFQSDLPVIHARFTVIIPEDWELHKSSRNLDPIEFVQNSNQYEWRAENLEYRPDEPLMPPWSRLNRKLSVSAYDPSTGGAPQFSNWQAVSKWAGELHRNPTNVNDSLAQLVASLTDDLPTKRGKLGAIARYLQEEIRYVAVEFGVGRFQPRMATTTFFNKYGDCKDKVTLMRAMLAQAGISAEPVLALVGGRVDRAFPTPFQFNHVILGVPLSEFTSHRGWAGAESDGWLFFDPTDESTPVGCLPLQLYDSRVLPATSSIW
ncbi:MAG: DUF3857 domain-containing transglutaminase family protein [Candidatus Zixiibacteriota bacterium]